MSFGSKLDRAQQLARDAASSGFSGMVVTEGARTAFLTCAAAALAAPGLDLATGISVAFARSPMVSAQLAWELADATGGRFRLGLGTQVRAHVTRRYGSEFDPPGPRMRDYVLAVKGCFRAFRGLAPLDVDTEHYRLSLLPAQWSPGPIEFPDPPVDVAAVNPWMLRMAGEVADGVHVHPLNTPRLLREVIRPMVQEGASRVGRDLRDLKFIIPTFSAVGDAEEDRARWRELARAQIAFYGSTPNYASVFEHLGWPGTTQRLRQHQKAGDIAGMTAVIDDSILSEFLIECRFEELAERLVDRYESLADRVVLYFAGAAWSENAASLERWGAAAAEVREQTRIGRL